MGNPSWLEFTFNGEEITNENYTEEKRELMMVQIEQLKKRTYLVWFFTVLGLVFIASCLFLKEEETILQDYRLKR